MRINLTSVEESKHAKQIEKLVKSIFPNYTVTVIPNKYATIEGKKQVTEYSKEYYQKNAEEIRRKRRERYNKQKNEKETAIKEGYYKLAKKLEEHDR